MNNTSYDNTAPLTTIGVKVQLTATSALYLFLAIALGSAAFFVTKKYV